MVQWLQHCHSDKVRCMEFACSPRVCIDSLQLLPTVLRHSHYIRLIGDSICQPSDRLTACPSLTPPSPSCQRGPAPASPTGRLCMDGWIKKKKLQCVILTNFGFSCDHEVDMQSQWYSQLSSYIWQLEQVDSSSLSKSCSTQCGSDGNLVMLACATFTVTYSTISSFISFVACMNLTLTAFSPWGCIDWIWPPWPQRLSYDTVCVKGF